MRSDVDRSGDINTRDEAKQLLTTIAFTLKDVMPVKLSPEILAGKIEELAATDLEANPMDFAAFWSWFVAAFDDKDNGAGAF